jgi:anti-sigma B factor antagonist
MKIEKKLDDGNLTIKVEGRLDTNTSPELEDEMNLDGVSKLVFDFSGLEYISSAGLRILIAAQKAMSASGGSLEIVGPNEAVRSVFEITGLDSVLVVEP